MASPLYGNLAGLLFSCAEDQHIWDLLQLGKANFSTDFIGENYAYPDADYALRERIIRAHVDYTKGMLYFLSTSTRVPRHVQAAINQWGLARDEFAARVCGKRSPKVRRCIVRSSPSSNPS